MDLNKRVFYLKNSNNEVYDLLGQFSPDSWLYKPQGLGFEKTINTVTVLNRKIITKVENQFPDISGTVLFKDYTEYSNFEEYASRSQINDDVENPVNYLKLYYQTMSDQDMGYYLVYIHRLDKSEKETNGRLLCEISFKRLSNYLIDRVLTVNNEVSLEALPTFPLGVDKPFIRFGSGFTSKLRLKIVSKSNLKIPVKFQIDGGFVNPTFVNNANSIAGGYFVTASNESLIVEANTPQYMHKNGVSIAQFQDMTKFNFLILSPGNNVIDFDLGQTNAYGAVTIFYTEERLSV